MSHNTHPFSDRETAILRYEPIELNGLVYHPLRMADYNEWQALKPVLCLRQGTLPAVYACMTYLQCVWALDYSANTSKDLGFGGIWSALARILFLSLRLSDSDKIQAIGVNPNDKKAISCIRIVKGETSHDISPMEFIGVRKLIADQNGAELPDEADNPDLVEAATDISNANSQQLNYSIPDMMTSVSSALGIRRKELFDWPIKEFEDEVRALRRRYGYFLASIAESQGAKFEKGNPYPTWLFDKAKDEFAGLISMSKIQADHRATINQSDVAPTQQQEGVKV